MAVSSSAGTTALAAEAPPAAAPTPTTPTTPTMSTTAAPSLAFSLVATAFCFPAEALRDPVDAFIKMLIDVDGTPTFQGQGGTLLPPNYAESFLSIVPGYGIIDTGATKSLLGDFWVPAYKISVEADMCRLSRSDIVRVCSLDTCLLRCMFRLSEGPFEPWSRW